MSFIICHSLGKLEDQPWYKYVKDWVVYTQFDYSGLKNQALKLPLHSTDKGIVYDNISFEDEWFYYFVLPHCDCNHNVPILIVSENSSILKLADDVKIKQKWKNIYKFSNSNQMIEHFSNNSF